MKWLLLLLLPLTLQACSSAASRNRQFAESQGLYRQVVQGQGMGHVLYFNPAALRSYSNLHVYLEGDGRPWINRRFVAADPTTVRPLMLRLMALDALPAIYLGRPCYEGLASTHACNPWWWTQGRYSVAVVDSLSRVLEDLARDKPQVCFTLIGHSGGGSLSMLVAARVEAVCQVVTLAANLDTDAWAEKQAYTPLQASLNPSAQPPLPARVTQYHYLGIRDENIPVPAVRRYLRSQPDSRVTMIENCGHADCWKKLWPDILREIKKNK